MRRSAGSLLVVAGALLLVGSLASGAALAPDRSVAAPDERLTLVGIQGDGPGLHEGGRVVLVDGAGETVWSFAGADSYFDVTMLDDGRVLAAFMSAGFRDCGPYEPPCARTGFQLIEPEPTPHVVSSYSFPVRSRQNSEVHDVEPLGDGRFLLTDMERERLLVVDADGSVTWQWNASRLYPAPADPTRVDWLHVNDVDRVGEGRYLVSVRNADHLVLVERGRGHVVYVDGDDGRFSRQHNPQWLAPDAVLVADSHGDRIVELHRNDSGEWTVAWSLAHAGGLAFDWPRDADRLPGGTTLVTDSVNRRVVEVDETGAVVWSVATDGTPYDADRLPPGESVGGPTYGGGADSVSSAVDIPLVSEVYAAIRVGVPLPFWFSAWHLLAVAVSAGLVIAGLWLHRASAGR